MQKYRAFVQMALASNWSLQIHRANPTIRGKYSESRTSQSFSHPSAPTDSATGGNLAWVAEEGWNELKRALNGPEVQLKTQRNCERVWNGLEQKNTLEKYKKPQLYRVQGSEIQSKKSQKHGFFSCMTSGSKIHCLSTEKKRVLLCLLWVLYMFKCLDWSHI